MTDWQSDLEAVVWMTKHERYRFLCSDDNNAEPPHDRQAYRALMAKMARGIVENPTPMQGVIDIGPHPCCGGDAVLPP